MNSKRKGKITFYNKNGTSVIDYCIVDKYSFDIIQDFYVGDFNIYSDHAPIFVSLMKRYSINKCTCKNASKTYVYEWNDDKKETTLSNVISKQEELSACVDDLISNKTTVNECVNNLTEMLHDIFDETCKRETRIGNNCSVHTNKRVIAHGHKPWFSDECIKLYNRYKYALRQFNYNRSH